MAYFNLSCCSPQTSKIVTLVLSILVICLGSVSIGYGGSINAVKTGYNDVLGSSTSATIVLQLKKMVSLCNGPMAYYVISGVIQILAGVLCILTLFQIVGKENRVLFFRLNAGALLITLAFAFCNAVYTALMMAFFNVIWEQVIQTDQALISAMPSPSKEMYISVRNHHSFTIAQAIIGFIIAVPVLIVLLYALFNEFVNDGSSGTTKVTPGKIAIQQKTQVESFGDANNSLQFVPSKK